MKSILTTIHWMVWGPWTLVLFLGTGVWFTLRSGFFQVRGFGTWWRSTVGSLFEGKTDDVSTGDWETGSDRKAGVTSFQSACTALAATIGTGNIVGVATALTAGGPGALFWMWISAAIGMMTAYAETYLGQRYRYRGVDGQWMCGPMVYMEMGLKCPAMGNLYALLAVLASLGMGSMVQSNSMSETIRLWIAGGVADSVSGAVVIDGSAGLRYVLPECIMSGPALSLLVGLAITVVAGIVILGGIDRISRVTERLMPLSAGIFLVFSLAVILLCRNTIPQVFAVIFRDALNPKAAGGGVGGFLLSRSVRYGLSRGVFSNEAGLGSLAVLHGAADETTPEQQGMWAMFEVFFDTIIICTLTALVILCVGYGSGPVAGNLGNPGSPGSLPSSLDGAALTAWCFSRKIGKLGEILVSGSMVVFAFATIIAWYYLGRQAASYLLERVAGGRFAGRMGKQVYTMLYLGAVFSGCIGRLEVVWMISDIWNGLMAYPNLLALWMLGGEVKLVLRQGKRG